MRSQMIDRTKVLARVTREALAVGDKPTWENLSSLMSEEERAAFQGKEVEVEVELPAAFSDELSVTDGAAAAAEWNSHRARQRAPTMPQNPYEAMRAVENDLNNARQELRDRRYATQASRVAFGRALEAWNLGAPVASHEAAAREFIAASNADRAAKAAANGGAIRHPGVTRTAAAMSGGGRRAGGGNAFRRGPGGQRTFSKEQAAAVGYRVPPKKAG